MTHICVSKLTIIGSDNGLSPDRRQAIILTNAGILLIGPLGTNFSEILIEILTFSFKKMRLKGSSAKRRPFCLGLNVLKGIMLWHPEYYMSHNKEHEIEVHYSDVIMSALVSQITGVSVVCSTVCLGANQRKHQRKGNVQKTLTSP